MSLYINLTKNKKRSVFRNVRIYARARVVTVTLAAMVRVHGKRVQHVLWVLPTWTMCVHEVRRAARFERRQDSGRSKLVLAGNHKKLKGVNFMGRKLDKPTLAQHVKIGQAIKDYRIALNRVIELTSGRNGCNCLYAKEADKLCNLFNFGALESIKSRLEDVMFHDFPWLSNDAFSVYYHDDEQLTLYWLYKKSGREYKPTDDYVLPTISNMDLAKPPTIEDVMQCAETFDRWTDHFADRIINECGYSSQESYWMDNLQHTHKEIAEMMRDAVMHEVGEN